MLDGWCVRVLIQQTSDHYYYLSIRVVGTDQKKEKKEGSFQKNDGLFFFFIESISQRKYSKTEQLLINILSRRYIILSSRLYTWGIDNRAVTRSVSAPSVCLSILHSFWIDENQQVCLKRHQVLPCTQIGTYTYLIQLTKQEANFINEQRKNYKLPNVNCNIAGFKDLNKKSSGKCHIRLWIGTFFRINERRFQVQAYKIISMGTYLYHKKVVGPNRDLFNAPYLHARNHAQP